MPSADATLSVESGERRFGVIADRRGWCGCDLFELNPWRGVFSLSIGDVLVR